MDILLPQEAGTEEAQAVSATWRLDLDAMRVTRERIDGEEAVRQAAALRLLVPRFAHLIYSFDYGSELESLVGKEMDYAQAAAVSIISEALTADDRIEEVSDFAFEEEGDRLTASFTVRLSDGAFRGQTVLPGSFSGEI